MSDFYQVLSKIFSEDILKAVILFFVSPLVLRYFESKFFSDMAQMKNVWNYFIKEKGSIKDCFERYKKIQQDSDCGILFYYLISSACVVSVYSILFLSFIASFFLFKLIASYPDLATLMDRNNITLDYLFIVIISLLFELSSLIPISLCGKLKNYALIEDDEVILKYAKVKKVYSTVVIYSFVFFLYSINILLSFNEYFNPIIICAMFLFLVLFYVSTLNIKEYTQKVKDNINNIYSRNFPYLEVSTLEGKDVSGKLENVFNLESIILNNEGEHTTILWSSISTLKKQSKNN